MHYFCCKNINKPLTILEAADIKGTCFAYLNNKGPDLNFAIKNNSSTFIKPESIDSLLVR